MQINITKKYYDKCGIYKIRNDTNGRFYVGSTKNLYERYRTHLTDLRKNKHANRFLQNDWNKYNQTATYTFSLLEPVAQQQTRLLVEQKWLDKLFNDPKCCNHKSKVNSKYRKHYSNTPEETKKKISSIKKENWKSLDYRKAQIQNQKKTKNSAEGKRKQSKISKLLWKMPDYRLKTTTNQKKCYSLVDPNGNLISFKGISDFAKKHKFSISSFYKLLKGEIYQHKGWTLPGKSKKEMFEKTRDNRARAFAGTYKMTSPNGAVITIFNMKKFCEQNNLCKQSMLKVFKGTYKQHKGWKRVIR